MRSWRDEDWLSRNVPSVFWPWQRQPGVCQLAPLRHEESCLTFVVLPLPHSIAPNGLHAKGNGRQHWHFLV